ncbi:AadA family aminoglycoside 3''-O-nucleotidyltransferase [Chloroflexia bacterium SDU3-3]|nr:AadA family aminoglycoside 3''-O-nucleotidyltransferase [Chloroflexia bacterium SDU3-3]
MTNTVPAEIAAQIAQTLGVIERHLAPSLLAVHLYGSALDGGLRPQSDIDLLVTLGAQPDDRLRRAVMRDLLGVSAPPGQSAEYRALEVTVVLRDELVPWRYPPRRELQFGEWLRGDIQAGNITPAVVDIDLAILLTKARHSSIALVGPAAASLFEPVPEADFRRVLADTLGTWSAPPDWAGDERNIVLTLARMWYSAATGKIAPKDAAADWALARLPAEHRPVLAEARLAYLGLGEDRLASRGDLVAAFILFAKREIAEVLRSAPATPSDLPTPPSSRGAA